MIDSIIFPQVALKLAAPINELPRLLITGGRPPATNWLRQMARTVRHGEVWAADHGVDACRAAGMLPDKLLGDGDSAGIDSWRWAEAAGVPTKKFPVAKDLTDTQLAIEGLAQMGAPYIIVTGAFGGRFDHAYSTIYSAAHAAVPCALIDEQEAIFFVRSGEGITIAPTARPKAISLLPITADCYGVTTENLRWELTGAMLKSSFPNAVSNELIADATEFSITIECGILAVYLYWGKY